MKNRDAVYLLGTAYHMVTIMESDHKLLSHWIQLITPLFTYKDTQFRPRPEKSDLRVDISWPLNTDQSERQNKHSKTIELRISQEAADNYKGRSPTRQEADDNKLVSFVKYRLSLHDPETDHGILDIPPKVTWLVCDLVLSS